MLTVLLLLKRAASSVQCGLWEETFALNMATNGRESRRRKIIERGSDRLAFITSRAASSSSSPPSDLYDTPETDLTRPLISPEPRLSDRPTVSPNGDDKAEVNTSHSTLPKQDPDASHTSAYHDERSVKSPLPECGASIEALSAPASVVNGKEQSSLISSTVQNSYITTPGTEEHLEVRRNQHKFFTPSQIRSAILATEHARLLCSVAVALLVVLSYLEFPLLGSSIIKSILSSRPLYLVLLTDVTVVLSPLLFHGQGGSQRAIRGENNIPSTEAYGWAAQTSVALEVGLMIQKIIDAIFMDCSVYSIILICALSFSKQCSH